MRPPSRPAAFTQQVRFIVCGPLYMLRVLQATARLSCKPALAASVLGLSVAPRTRRCESALPVLQASARVDYFVSHAKPALAASVLRPLAVQSIRDPRRTNGNLQIIEPTWHRSNRMNLILAGYQLHDDSLV